MHRLGVGYTKYFNLKNDRVGSLFQGAYKAKIIDSPDYLNYLSAYIHGNPAIHNYGHAEEWPWSSYRGYLEQEKWSDDTDHPIIGNFENANDYRQFVDGVVNSSRESKLAKKCEF